MFIYFLISDYLPQKPDMIDLTDILPVNENHKPVERVCEIESIVIHNDAIFQNGTLRIKNISRYHIIERDYSSIAYHYYISAGGVIYHCVNNNLMTAHTIGYNANTLAICLNGNFDIEFPSIEQKRALKCLLSYLKKLYSIQYVYLHSELNSETTCPGKNFNL
jgi:N-acetylmuramoyl-L-alanine amidase